MERRRPPGKRPSAGRDHAEGDEPIPRGDDGCVGAGSIPDATRRRREGRGGHHPAGKGGREERDRCQQRRDQPVSLRVDERPRTPRDVQRNRQSDRGSDGRFAAGRLRGPADRANGSPHGVAPGRRRGFRGRASGMAVGLLPTARAGRDDRDSAGGRREVCRQTPRARGAGTAGFLREVQGRTAGGSEPGSRVPPAASCPLRLPRREGRHVPGRREEEGHRRADQRLLRRTKGRALQGEAGRRRHGNGREGRRAGRREDK